MSFDKHYPLIAKASLAGVIALAGRMADAHTVPMSGSIDKKDKHQHELILTWKEMVTLARTGLSMDLSEYATRVFWRVLAGPWPVNDDKWRCSFPVDNPGGIERRILEQLIGRKSNEPER